MMKVRCAHCDNPQWLRSRDEQRSAVSQWLQAFKWNGRAVGVRRQRRPRLLPRGRMGERT